MPRIRDEQKCNRRTLNAVNNLHRDSSFVPPLASRARHSYGSSARVGFSRTPFPRRRRVVRPASANMASRFSRAKEHME